MGEAGTKQHDSFSRPRPSWVNRLGVWDFAATEPQSGERGPEWAEREGVSVTCSDSLPDFAATFTVGEGL